MSESAPMETSTGRPSQPAWPALGPAASEDLYSRGCPLPLPPALKAEVLLRAAREHALRTFVETGTYRGDTVASIRGAFESVYTVELDETLHQAAVQRFAGDRHVRCLRGDSAAVLPSILRELREPALFWLDAHYSGGCTARGDKDTPVMDELARVLAPDQPRHVVLVDDARFFGFDPRYPSIREVSEQVASARPDYGVDVLLDIVRIAPRPTTSMAPSRPGGVTPRTVLERGLELERGRGPDVHPEWSKARLELRTYVEKGDLSTFLRHPVCRQMFVRMGWGEAQQFELAALKSDACGRQLLAEEREPGAGCPEIEPRLGTFSSNTLGMLYYLLRLRHLHPEAWPDHIIEIGGGYGGLCRLLASRSPGSSYAIVDLPEMLALQHYFLSAAMPERSIVLVDAPDVRLHPGEIALVPAALLDGMDARADLLISTFALSEMPRAAQAAVERRDYFGASTLLLAGQLAHETPQLGWVHHREIMGAVAQRFGRISVERFHIGHNYLLEARR